MFFLKHTHSQTILIIRYDLFGLIGTTWQSILYVHIMAVVRLFVVVVVAMVAARFGWNWCAVFSRSGLELDPVRCSCHHLRLASNKCGMVVVYTGICTLIEPGTRNLIERRKIKFKFKFINFNVDGKNNNQRIANEIVVTYFDMIALWCEIRWQRGHRCAFLALWHANYAANVRDLNQERHNNKKSTYLEPLNWKLFEQSKYICTYLLSVSSGLVFIAVEDKRSGDCVLYNILLHGLV